MVNCLIGAHSSAVKGGFRLLAAPALNRAINKGCTVFQR